LAIIEFRVLRSSNFAFQDQRKSRSGIINFAGWRDDALRDVRLATTSFHQFAMAMGSEQHGHSAPMPAARMKV
jgi:hypothetical protein